MSDIPKSEGEQPAFPGAGGSLPFYIRLAHVLAKHGVIDAGSIEDPEGWDRSQTLQSVAMAAAEIERDNDDKARLDWLLNWDNKSIGVMDDRNGDWIYTRDHLDAAIREANPKLSDPKGSD